MMMQAPRYVKEIRNNIYAGKKHLKKIKAFRTNEWSWAAKTLEKIWAFSRRRA